MDKIDKVINIFRNLKEEMATGSSSGTPGFSSKSPAEGPTAGFDPLMGKKTRKNGKIDFRRIRSLHKNWVKSLDK